MCENDSFFDNIEIVPSASQTFRKAPTVCRSLEKMFAACNNAPTVKKSMKHMDEPKPTVRTASFHLNSDHYLKKQLNKQSRSFLYLRQQTDQSNNSTCIQSSNKLVQIESYLNAYKRLNIQVEPENTQQFISNIRQKTQSSHNTNNNNNHNNSTQINSYQISLVSLLRQRANSKQQANLANICKTLQDDARLKVSSTHRSSVYQPPKMPRQDSLNMRKSNSVYMQEFRKVFSKAKLNK